MNRRNDGVKLLGLVMGSVAVAMLSSCGFNIVFSALPVCAAFDEIDLTEVEGDPPAVVFEEPGAIKVMHGIGRATWTSGSTIKVEQSAELPAYANRATVFLNGWRAEFAGDDHHVAGLGTMIARIEVQRGRITWKAAGGIGDDSDNPRPFNWSYAYTIIAWNDANLQAMIDHNDDEAYCKGSHTDGSDNFFDASNALASTALASFRSFLENPGFASGRQVAVLPRGYGFVWEGGDDHHLLQLAYNLESAAPLIEHGRYNKGSGIVDPLGTPGTARVGAGFVSWNTDVIFKDNAARRDYLFAEIVSGMGGADVEYIQPPFSMQPENTSDGGIGGSSKVDSAEYVVENLPYLCAVPALTGWNIGYLTSDQHVREIGIWLSDVRYERAPGAAVGTLRYRLNSIVRDNDADPDNFSSHKVSIVGLKAGAIGGRDVMGGVRQE